MIKSEKVVSSHYCTEIGNANFINVVLELCILPPRTASRLYMIHILYLENEYSDSCPDYSPFIVLNQIHESCIASLVMI